MIIMRNCHQCLTHQGLILNMAQEIEILSGNKRSKTQKLKKSYVTIFKSNFNHYYGFKRFLLS